jgi:hypothetical protein
MVFITILYDLGLEMSSETRVKVSWSTPFTSGHLGFELLPLELRYISHVWYQTEADEV